MNALPELVGQTTALLREGAAADNTPPRVLMERIPAQVQAQIVDDPAKSPFYKPFTRFPDSIPQAERTALQAEAKQDIATKIVTDTIFSPIPTSGLEAGCGELTRRSPPGSPPRFALAWQASRHGRCRRRARARPSPH